MRRKDTPWFVKTMQARLLELMSEMKDVREISARAPELIREAGFYLNDRGGRVDPKQYGAPPAGQKEADEYATNNLSAMVVGNSASSGDGEGRRGDRVSSWTRPENETLQKAKSMLTYQHWDGYDIEIHGFS